MKHIPSKHPLTVILFFSTVLFAACSQLGQSKRTEDEEETLRSVSINRDSEVPWTDELEPDRLTTPINATDGIEKRVALSPLSVLAGSAEKNVSPIFPYLENLGILDYTAFPESAQSVLEAFCNAYVAGEKTESYISEHGLYLLALFYRDVYERITPLKPQLTENTDAEPEKQPDFTEFLYGSPFVALDFLQVPVRFSGTYAEMITSIFLIREKDTWKIDQIQICSWEAL